MKGDDVSETFHKNMENKNNLNVSIQKETQGYKSYKKMELKLLFNIDFNISYGFCKDK